MDTKPEHMNTASVTQGIEEVIVGLRKFADQRPQDDPYRFLVSKLADELTSVAGKEDAYSSVRQVIQFHQDFIDVISSGLRETLTHLEGLEQIRLRREKYSPSEWNRTVQALQKAFAENPEAAFHQWITSYAQALIDWELQTCASLVSTQFSYTRDQQPYILLIRHGDASLQQKDYPRALRMLRYLVDRLSGETGDDERLLSALVLVFIGRIHLYQTAEPEVAREAFHRAAELAPRDGRPLAGQGHLSLAEGQDGWAEANRLFSRAVEFSPDQPEGYVGKAMLAESRSLWSEADDWYKAAIQAAQSEANLVQSLSKLLAPGSGRLYLHIARQAFADNLLEPALTAIDRSLEVGMDDGSDYPSRSLITLKAEILLTKSGAERSPEEAKTIADLYFEAGRYYYGNNEPQTAAELFKKSRALDDRNALLLFYLADDLRLLSYKSTPPYYISELVYESLEVWEAGVALSEAIDSDTAWVYIARSSIAKQLSLLPDEDQNAQAWQAILFDEQALLFDETPEWWSALSDSFNALALYANMLHTARKAAKGGRGNISTKEARAQALMQTGQYKQAATTLNKLFEVATPENMRLYQGWRAQLNFYLGNYKQALEDLKPSPDRELSVSDLYWRALIYRAMGKHQASLEDAQWIWEKRKNPDYEKQYGSFAWAAFLLGKFEETTLRVEPLFASARAEDRFDARLLLGVSRLALGNFRSADEHLSQALEECDNPRLLVAELIMELEQLQQRATRENWPRSASIIAYLKRPGGILERAKSKQKEMKKYKADPIKELENVLSSPTTGDPGSWGWLAAQAGLGRLHLEAEQMEAAKQAYQELSLYSEQVPEARIGLNKASKSEQAADATP